jgi:hypothetical protein
MNADLILVLDRGRIVQRGTHADLMAEDGIYRRVYELQARIGGELEGTGPTVDESLASALLAKQEITHVVA